MAASVTVFRNWCYLIILDYYTRVHIIIAIIMMGQSCKVEKNDTKVCRKLKVDARTKNNCPITWCHVLLAESVAQTWFRMRFPVG